MRTKQQQQRHIAKIGRNRVRRQKVRAQLRKQGILGRFVREHQGYGGDSMSSIRKLLAHLFRPRMKINGPVELGQAKQQEEDKVARGES